MSDRSRARRERRRSRGQSLVEFALVLPVLLLIVLVGIDFGRMLYGWVILQNSARIAANYAGLNPDGWKGSGEPAVVAEYEDLIERDLDTANCSATPTPPAPVWADGPDTAVTGGSPDSSYDVGDSVSVSLACDFRPLTPIISSIVGSTFEIGATSHFRIRAGDLVGLADPTRIPPPSTPTPLPSSSSSAPPSCTIDASFTRAPNGVIRNGDPITFTSTSTVAGCAIASYSWTFQLASPASASTVGPHTVTFAVPARQDVVVSLTVTSSTGVSNTENQTFNVRP